MAVTGREGSVADMATTSGVVLLTWLQQVEWCYGHGWYNII